MEVRTNHWKNFLREVLTRAWTNTVSVMKSTPAYLQVPIYLAAERI